MEKKEQVTSNVAKSTDFNSQNEVSRKSLKKNVFNNKFKNRKGKILNKRSKEKEKAKKEKRKFKQQFIVPETIAFDGYSSASNLKEFLNKYGKIESRKINKLPSKKYRKISKAIKNMRILGFIPFLKK